MDPESYNRSLPPATSAAGGRHGGRPPGGRPAQGSRNVPATLIGSNALDSFPPGREAPTGRAARGRGFGGGAYPPHGGSASSLPAHAAGGEGQGAASAADAVPVLLHQQHRAASPAGAAGLSSARRLDAVAAAPLSAAALAAAAAAAAAAATGAPAGAFGGASPPTLDLRLLNSKWEFRADEPAQLLTDNTDFLVVGVLGAQGAGKSSLLNTLLPPQQQQQPPLPGPGSAPFAVQGPQHIAQQRHCTGALEIRLAPAPDQRTICLDSPPLWSGSALADLAAGTVLPQAHASAGAGTVLSRAMVDARAQGFPALSAEATYDLMALQMATWLLAVCHVVVVMVESVDDPRLLELLQAADLLAHSLQDVAAAAAASMSAASPAAAVAPGIIPSLDGGMAAAGQQQGARRVAELAVVLCGVAADSMTADALGPQRELLQEALAGTRLLSQHAGQAGTVDTLRTGRVAAGGGGRQANGVSHSGAGHGGGSGGGGRHLHFFVLGEGAWTPPEQADSGHLAGSGARPSTADGLQQRLLQQQQQRLRPALLRMPRRAFSRPLSERDWLRGSERLWQQLQRSPHLEQYQVAAQRTAFAGGGGWPLVTR